MGAAMPVVPSLVFTAVFVLLCLVCAVLCLQQWRRRGEQLWEALSLTAVFGSLAAFMDLERFGSPNHLSARSWAAFAAAMVSILLATAASRARWRKTRERSA